MSRGWGLAAVVAALGAACSDPTLSLEFAIQPPYRAMVSTIGLREIVPPVGAAFSCGDLAFGRVEPQVVALAQASALMSSTLRTPIAAIPRVGRKLFIADGYDLAQAHLVTGCVELDDIKEDTTVEIVAEPVVHTSTPAGTALSAPAGGGPPPPVPIAVRDALGEPLAGVHAEWSIDGVAGTASAGKTDSDDLGRLMIAPTLPNRAGPFVLEVRVRWAEPPALALSGVVLSPPTSLDLGARALDYAAGGVGPNGERGFAALLSEGTGDRVAVAYRDPASTTAHLVMVVHTSAQVSGASQLGLVQSGGRGRDRILAVSDAQWVEVAGDGSLTARTYMPPSGVSAPNRVLTTGDCAPGVPPPGTQAQVLVGFPEGIFATYAAEGGAPLDTLSQGAVTDLRHANLLASGCVADQTGVPVRTWAVDFGSDVGVVLLVPPIPLLASWLTLPSGIAFSPPANAMQQIFGTQISVNDIVVSRAILERSPPSGSGTATVALAVQGFDAVPSAPFFTATGDLDGDGIVDVVSLFPRDAAGTQLALWFVLGRQHAAHRIAGDVNIPLAMDNPMLMVADVDGDRFDDVILAEVPQSPTAGTSRVAVFPMGR